MKTPLLMLIRLYRLFFSPFLGTHCRFVPSCSCYAHEAVMQHGVVHGSLLAAKRLLRCHPFAASGFDPVPSSYLHMPRPLQSLAFAIKRAAMDTEKKQVYTKYMRF